MISQDIIIDGKNFRISLEGQFKVTALDTPVPIPDPDPIVVTEPTEGTIKEGGWGANTNANKWSSTNMRSPPEEFKVVDENNVNVATNFKTNQAALDFISYFKVNPFPPVSDTEPTDPVVDDPPVVGNGVTKDGVKIPYETTGKMEYVFKHNDRDDGKRMDFNNLKAAEYVNAVVVGYFAFPKDNAPDDEVSGKFSAMSHSGSNRTECFDMGTGIKDGATRIRYEAVHPEYTGDLGNGQKGLPLKTKFIGYMYARKNLPNGNVLCEQWQDQGDNEGSTPANKWVKLFSWEDPKYQFKDYEDGHTVTIRVDGSNVVDDMKLKWLALVEIK